MNRSVISLFVLTFPSCLDLRFATALNFFFFKVLHVWLHITQRQETALALSVNFMKLMIFYLVAKSFGF